MKKYIRITDGNPFVPKGTIVEALKLTKQFIADKRKNGIKKETIGKLDVVYDSEDSILTLNTFGWGNHHRLRVDYGEEFDGLWIVRNIEDNGITVPFGTEFIKNYKFHNEN